MVVAETLPSGLRLVTEQMPHVRSVTVGVWLARGSRHESDAESGVAHFVEHMLFKGTTSRSAREIAQTIDSVTSLIPDGNVSSTTMVTPGAEVPRHARR